MKACAVCHTGAEESQATCLVCGEASWRALERGPSVDAPDGDPDVVVDESPAPVSKGRRR